MDRHHSRRHSHDGKALEDRCRKNGMGCASPSRISWLGLPQKNNDHWYAMATHWRCRCRYRKDESLRHQKFHWQELRQIILISLTIQTRRKELINSINK